MDREVAEIRNFFFYLSIVVELFIVFLLAAASLPDDVDGGVDLGEYYAANHRYFWSLALLFQCFYYAHWLFFVVKLGRAPSHLTREIVFGVAEIAAPLILLSI